MPDLSATDLVDLTATTQRHLTWGEYAFLGTDLQDFPAHRNLFRKGRMEEKAGLGVQWNVMINHTGTARPTGWGASDNPRIVSTQIQASCDWRGTSADWSFLAEEVSANSGSKERIVALIKEREVATMVAIAELREDLFFGPPVSVTDTISPWGLKTWIVKNATEGFNGGAPSGFTTIGLNPSTYGRWKNYTAQYTAVSDDDLVDKLKRAIRKCKFKPPVDNIPTPGTADTWAYYTNESGMSQYEALLKTSNDNVGMDLTKFLNTAQVARLPLGWVPKLDADTTDPFYGVNFGKAKVVVLPGWWQRRTNVPIYPGQHTMSVTFLDDRYQVVFYDRRSNFVLSTGTTEPS